MRKVLVVLVVLVTALVASANLLTNPDFEISDGGTGGDGRTPSGWWAYNQVSSEGWAARNGTNGMAFWSWNNGTYGGFGQDVTTNLVSTDILTFSIYGLAEANFESSSQETWLKIEYWTNGASAYSRQDTFDIYSLITASPDTWNQYTMITTVGMDNVTMVKPIVGGGGFTNVGGSQAVKWDDADFTVTNAIPEPTIAGLLGFAGLLICALRRKNRK